jgi:DNA-binding CsgD family transcriptional regulator
MAIVASTTGVSEAELRTMLRIVNAPDLGEDGEGLPLSTLDELGKLFPGAVIAFNGIDVKNRRHYFVQATDGTDRDHIDHRTAFWTYYDGPDCAYPERSGDWRSVTMTTDFGTMLAHRQTPMYVDFCKLYDIDHEMVLSMPDGPGRQLRLVVMRGRSEPGFTERDRALLVLLRPHLRAAHEGVLERRSGIPKLTARQWELLHLVDAGLSNSQIAHRLHITENTVRKHLENIFLRLQVGSRTAALARVFPRRAPG